MKRYKPPRVPKTLHDFQTVVTEFTKSQQNAPEEVRHTLAGTLTGPIPTLLGESCSQFFQYLADRHKESSEEDPLDGFRLGVIGLLNRYNPNKQLTMDFLIGMLLGMAGDADVLIKNVREAQEAVKQEMDN